MSLNRFVEEIKIAKKPIGKAYIMDSTRKKNNMRKTVDLGTCHCCDYFVVSAQSVILIEETRLLQTIKRLRREYRDLSGKKRDAMVNKRIRDEMQLKAYGTMLVLCRLSMKCASARNLIQGRKCQFWLVASSIDTPGKMRYFDNLKDSLKNDLGRILSKILLDDVDVLSADTLKEWLSNNATTP